MPEAFDLTLSPRKTPVVVEVPHAGLEVPADLAPSMRAGERDRARDADLHVDKLYEHAPELGAALLVARLSRYVCDLNRNPDDVDLESVKGHPSPHKMAPRGFIWRLTTEGTVAIERPLTLHEWQARVDRVWMPYHDALARLLREARSGGKGAILLAGHSMPSVGRVGHTDPGSRRADIVPGWRGGSSCDRKLHDLVVDHFKSRDYSVAVDDPYRGGGTTARYGQPGEGVHAIQIEINRGLYMDEQTLEIREPGFGKLKMDLERLIEALAGLSLPAA